MKKETEKMEKDENVKMPGKEEEEYKCDFGHVLKSKNNYECKECLKRDKHAPFQYYPETNWNRYHGNDTIRKESILNNENGNFQVSKESEEESITDRKLAIL